VFKELGIKLWKKKKLILLTWWGNKCEWVTE
jgi:hypothetical protein